MIKKYVKKPIVVEAMLYTGDTESFQAGHDFMGTNLLPDLWAAKYNSIYIQTLEGLLYVNSGDYIIKGVRGEFYPCKPDIFEETYAEVLGETE